MKVFRYSRPFNAFKNNLEKQQHEINELRKLINSMLKKDNVDELESPENFAS